MALIFDLTYKQFFNFIQIFIMSKRILVVLSEWGYWGEELVGPLDVLNEAGYTLDFMTPFGRNLLHFLQAWMKNIWILL